MTAHDFSAAQLRHVNALCGSAQLTTFTAAMRLDTEATRWLDRAAAYITAHRPAWDRQDALYAKADAGTITSAEACELLTLERDGQ